jgi:Ran GTPase-activating protein (RanGAP) involved in mRNA processing and transport
LGVESRWVPFFNQLTELRHLDLTNNLIGASQMQNIERGLWKCGTLTHLDMTQNQLHIQGFSTLQPLLLRCTGLTHLILSDTQLNDGGAEFMHAVFRTCTKLVHIDLSSNHIHRPALSPFLQAMKNCTSLTHANLSNGAHTTSNHVAQNEAGSTLLIAETLRSFPNLAELKLSRTLVEQDGASVLANHLPHYTALTHLDLSYNEFRRNTPLLLPALARCTKLEKLNMRGNFFLNDEADQLLDTCFEIVRVSRKKLEVDVTNNGFDHRQDLADRCAEQARQGNNVVLKGLMPNWTP